MFRRLLSPIVLAFALAAPAVASAQAPSAPLSESLSGDAKQNYESGKVLYGDGDFAGALVKFKSAYDASRDPRLLWNIAACEKELRHYARVIDLLREYRSKASLSPDEDKQAVDVMKVLEALVVSVNFKINEPGADVYVDDAKMGTSPLGKPVSLDVGIRKIRISKPGFKDYQSSTPVGGASQLDVDVKLERDIHEGKLVVSTGKYSIITIDGSVVGSERFEGILPSGGHTLKVTEQGMRAYQSEVVIQDGQTRRVSVNLEPEKSGGGLPAWAWIAGGVVVAGGAATASYFALKKDDTIVAPPAGQFGSSPGLVELSRIP